MDGSLSRSLSLAPGSRRRGLESAFRVLVQSATGGQAWASHPQKGG